MLPLSTIYYLLFSDKKKKRDPIRDYCPDGEKHHMFRGRCLRCGYTK